MPKLARAAGQSKGEFHKGLQEVTGEPSTANTEADLEAGGKTKAVDVAQKRKRQDSTPLVKQLRKLRKNFQKKMNDFEKQSSNPFHFHWRATNIALLFRLRICLLRGFTANAFQLPAPLLSAFLIRDRLKLVI